MPRQPPAGVSPAAQDMLGRLRRTPISEPYPRREPGTGHGLPALGQAHATRRSPTSEQQAARAAGGLVLRGTTCSAPVPERGKGQRAAG
jgi:hypothetical protein